MMLMPFFLATFSAFLIKYFGDLDSPGKNQIDYKYYDRSRDNTETTSLNMSIKRSEITSIHGSVDQSACEELHQTPKRLNSKLARFNTTLFKSNVEARKDSASGIRNTWAHENSAFDNATAS